MTRETIARVQRARRLDQVAQRAVDAQAHHRARLERLDVDVGGAVAQRLREQRIDQADDRRIVLAFEQILDLGNFLQQPRQIQVLRQIVGQRGRAGVGAVVQRGDQLVELLGADAARVQRHAERAAHFGERPRVRAVAHRHLGQLAVQRGDDDAVGLGEGVGTAMWAIIVLLGERVVSGVIMLTVVLTATATARLLRFAGGGDWRAAGSVAPSRAARHWARASPCAARPGCSRSGRS